ncbi:PALP domain-containing protein [Psidium guajava]|nr:PALP domain-containing protein [Psidium guajava]
MIFLYLFILGRFAYKRNPDSSPHTQPDTLYLALAALPLEFLSSEETTSATSPWLQRFLLGRYLSLLFPRSCSNVLDLSLIWVRLSVDRRPSLSHTNIWVWDLLLLFDSFMASALLLCALVCV